MEPEIWEDAFWFVAGHRGFLENVFWFVLGLNVGALAIKAPRWIMARRAGGRR